MKYRVYVDTPVEYKGKVLDVLEESMFEVDEEVTRNGSVRIYVFKPRIKTPFGLKLNGRMLATYLRDIDPGIKVYGETIKA